MIGLRQIARTRPALALLLVAFTLAARFIVPAGFMPVRAGEHVLIVACTGTGPMTMPGPQSGKQDSHAGGETCPFAAAALPLIGGITELAVLASIFFGAASDGLPSAAVRVKRVWLRPPLRGPPSALSA